MKDLKEAVAKIVTQTWCEPLAGRVEWARYLSLPKPDILSVTQSGIGGGWAMTQLSILPGDRPPVSGSCNYDSESPKRCRDVTVMSRWFADETVVVVKLIAYEDMVTYLRIKL